MTTQTSSQELFACEVAVLRALEVAGKKSLGRSHRGAYTDIPAHLLHTHRRIAATHTECDRLLAGAWDHLAIVLPNQPKLYTAVDWYVRELIVKSRPHARADLEAVLAVANEA
ncbi:hypothetical protein DEU38_103177 [Rhodococcus sp. AG1013]|uniref:hypothetical protein n=1 Tax=Rhodococcus sp. AG1013 TaxID=2183996 RepID=UPI000E0AEAB5|nr:hypothetical protein [Rhodococcus sp. AG1013]RDI32444.1 hypothetical protein DEU38_103177 [Rhodococcus sp. AG1013]